MANKPLPTPEQLRQLLTYIPETGELFWKARPRSMFPSDWSHHVWNIRYAGMPAFYAKNNHGYLQGKVHEKIILAHRAIWAMEHGAWPVHHIDHANGQTTDNRMSNLREATPSQNQWNKTNTLRDGRVIGVRWAPSRNKWEVRLRAHRKDVYTRYFDSYDEAVAARAMAARKFHGEYASRDLPIKDSPDGR